MSHTPMMQGLLRETYAGDLRDWWVYGSVQYPLGSIRIEGAAILPMWDGPEARVGEWTVYEYIVVPTPLSGFIADRYQLIFVSEPGEN